MKQIPSIISQYLPWFDKKPNLDHILATIMSPLPIWIRVHSTTQLTSQWIHDIMTPLANNHCNMHPYNHQQQHIIIIIIIITVVVVVVRHHGSVMA